MKVLSLDPSAICIEQEDWLSKKDKYIDRLTLISANLSKLHNWDLAWHDAYEEAIWTAPIPQPWTTQRQIYSSVTQVLYLQISRKRIRIQHDDCACNAIVEPMLYCRFNSLYSAFTAGISYLRAFNAELCICLSPDNDDKKTAQISVNENEYIPRPKLLNNQADFDSCINVIELYWPSNSMDFEKLNDAICEWQRIRFPDIKFLRGFQFDRSFIKKLSETDNDRDKILSAICLRLSMTRRQAADDQRIQDEEISSSIRRFRVTQRPSSKRIHYKDTEQGLIFTAYFDRGEHDDGL